MLVGKSLKLAVRPAIEDPILGGSPGGLSLVLRLVPRVLYLGDERIFAGLGTFLSLDTLLLQISTELVRIPVLVGRDSVVLPVLLEQVLEVLAVGGSRVRDVVVRQPALKLCLVPLVVCCI